MGAVEAEAKYARKEAVKTQDSTSQNDLKEGSTLTGRASRPEAKRSSSENTKGGSLQNDSSEHVNGNSSKADEKLDSSEQKDVPPAKRPKTLVPDHKELRRL